MKDSRKVPVKSLMKRLKILKYELHARLSDETLAPAEVVIPLKMHVGAPAVAVVRTGDVVQQGQVIAESPPDALGVAIHASISGTVSLGDGAVTIRA